MKHNIFHIDINCYFASVHESIDKSLVNYPIAVGGINGKGVVASCNQLARSYGVKAAMKIYDAKSICPNLVILGCEMNLYLDISYKIYFLLKSDFKYVEVGSIDEWYIDVSSSQFENWKEEEFISFYKQKIYDHFSLHCTIGCSFTKFFAKMATEFAKPDKIIVISKDNFKETISNTLVKDIFGVGYKFAKKLNDRNIFTVNDIYKLNDYQNDQLKNEFGIVWSKITESVNGVENTQIETNNQPKNIGRNRTIKNYRNYEDFDNLFTLISKSLNKSLYFWNLSYKNIFIKIEINDQKTINIKIKTDPNQLLVNKNTLLFHFDSNVSNNVYPKIFRVSVMLSNIENIYFQYNQENLFESSKNNLDDLVININHKLKSNILVKAIDLKKNYNSSR